MGTHLLKNDDQVGLCDRRCFAAGQHVSRRVPVQEGLFLFQRGCRSTPGSYVARMCYCVCCARRAGGCGGGWTLASDAAEHAVVGDCACVSGCDKETAARYSPELEASWKEAVEAGINTVPYVTVNGVYIGGTPQDIVDAVAASKANFKPMESTSIGVALVPLFIICICCAGGVAGAYKILAPALAGNASAAFPAMGRANGPIVAGGVVQEPRTRFVDHSSSGDASDDLDGSRFAAGLAPLSDEDSV